MKRVPMKDKISGFNEQCSQSTLLVIKEIRLVTPGVLASKSNVGILHLVRDVRAVVNSRLRLDGFCLHKGALGCAKPVCDGISQSLAGMKSLRSTQQRYLMIRFENVCDEPLENAKKIYDWLGFDFTTAASDWVKASTNSATAPDGPGKYGTARANSSRVAHGWETQLGESSLVSQT